MTSWDKAAFPHGEVGEIAKWIYSRSLRPNVQVSVSAALAAMSAHKFGVVEGHTGLRTNLYLLLLAPTGTGKNRVMEAVKAICLATEESDLMMGRPASGPGLIAALVANGGRKLCVWDEFGHYVQALTGGQSLDVELSGLLLEMFSCAASQYRGKEYANGIERPPVVIDNPHLSLLAASTQESFETGLRQAIISDGFLPRFIILNTGMGEEEREIRLGEVPTGIVESLRAYTSYRTNPDSISSKRGNLAWMYPGKPEVASFIDGATESSWKEVCNITDRYLAEGDRAAQESFRRAKEHVLKLALTLADGFYVSALDVEYAWSLVEPSCLYIADASRRCRGRNELERTIYLLLGLIPSYPAYVSLTDILRATPHIGKRMRKEALEFIVDANWAITSKLDGIEAYARPS